jgi:hypothetical protein
MKEQTLLIYSSQFRRFVIAAAGTKLTCRLESASSRVRSKRNNVLWMHLLFTVARSF